VLATPWTFTLDELRYLVPPDRSHHILELTLRRGSESRRLQFTQPQNLRIDAGFDPQSLVGLSILDVSARQLSGIGVEVAWYENSPGLSFVARDVMLIE
jgi:hypothetical protein